MGGNTTASALGIPFSPSVTAIRTKGLPMATIVRLYFDCEMTLSTYARQLMANAAKLPGTPKPSATENGGVAWTALA